MSENKRRLKIEHDERHVFLCLSEEDHTGFITNSITLKLSGKEAEDVGDQLFITGRKVTPAQL